MVSQKEKVYNYPVVRLGNICRTRHKFNKEDSKYVQDKLVASYKYILDNIVKELKLFGCKFIEISKEEKPLPQTYECPIVNLPQISFLIKDFGINVRNSIAICCRPNHYTKIWLRMSLKELNKKDAFNISNEDVVKFFDVSQEISSKISDSLDNVYFSFLKEIGKPRKKMDSYKFIIKTANTNCKRFYSLLDRIHDYNLLEMEGIIEDKKSSDILGKFFSMYLEGTDNIYNTYRSMISDKKHKWLVYDWLDGEKLSGIFSLKTDKECSQINGVTYSNANEFGTNIASEKCSREVLKLFASKL